MKASVQNPRGSEEKLSPYERVEGAYTVLRGSVRAPREFSSGKPSAAKLRGLRPLCSFAGRLALFASGLALLVSGLAPSVSGLA